LHRQGHHDRGRGQESSGGRGQGHRGVQPRRPGAGSVPLYRRGAARHRGRCGRPDDHSGGRRHPHRHGRVQGPGPGRGRGADRPALRHHGVRCRCRGRQDLCGKAEGRAGRHHGYVRRPLPGGHQPLHAVRVLSSAPASNHSAAPRMRGGASLFSYSRSARQARCQRSTTASCSGVWNQCSPASSTVRRQPFRAAKASTVSRSVRWSRAPYRMAVGVRHRRAGWVRTYRRYSQERVWPNVVGMRPSRASRSSLTPAQPIILRIRASMSTTGERNSAPARGASGYASRPNQAPRLEPKSPTRSHLPRSSARAHRSSGTTCQ
ncbi:hypothetical protein ICNMLN_ICNMLN_04730, partial [Dysosmobacter welbionis]